MAGGSSVGVATSKLIHSPTYLLTILYAGREVPLGNRLGHIPEDNDAFLVSNQKLVGVGGAELDGADLSWLGLGGHLDAKDKVANEEQEGQQQREEKRREMRRDMRRGGWANYKSTNM